MDKLKEMTIKAIENCKVCQCNECPFNGYPSRCLAVLEYLVKTERNMQRNCIGQAVK